ncbi:MAG: NADH-quinone oxidoreductase subunit NuoE [Phycisphaerales bacterium]|nr:NADH-quinone oxidoreductase subunit NuoE [Phycisphaerae bacterium]NNF42584.1 NADH-quinone oxidoreductase subunit NuoE [Phycisphaerales bacterium]NNM26840.1 NADH-quinone oxidoreductase subunit NuoE [Phycisphaerales bacterium]
MAWIVKPSATTTIPRRDKPYLTDKMKKHYRAEIIPRYERPQGALMPILHDVQHDHGHIPYQAMVEIAQLLEIHPADVLDTVSFYEEYTTEPVGKYVVGVCQSIACEVCGHQTILDHLRRKLEIEPHETTKDGRFTLLAMECLGACEGAPCALVNGDRHDNLTIESLDALLDALPD